MCGRVAGGWALGGWGNCGGQGTNPASLYLHWGFWEGGRGYKLKVRMGDISMKQWKIVSGITWYEYQWWRGEEGLVVLTEAAKVEAAAKLPACLLLLLLLTSTASRTNQSFKKHQSIFRQGWSPYQVGYHLHCNLQDLSWVVLIINLMMLNRFRGLSGLVDHQKIGHSQEIFLVLNLWFSPWVPFLIKFGNFQ